MQAQTETARIFTILHLSTLDGETDDFPFSKAYRSLEAAKAAALEHARDFLSDLFDEEAELPEGLEWTEANETQWTARFGDCDEDQEDRLVITAVELV